MTSLSNIRSGQHCRIKWMIGQTAEDIREFCRIKEDDEIDVVSNCGSGSVIIRSGSRRFALNEAAAYTIKVDAV